jgi:hypothetical protein
VSTAGQVARSRGTLVFEIHGRFAALIRRLDGYLKQDFYQLRSRRAIGALLRLDPADVEVKKMIEELAQCGSQKRRCRLVACPVCGERARRKEVRKSLKQLIARIGRVPDRTEISFVTILGPIVPLDAEAVKSSASQLKQSLYNVSRQYRGLSWIAYFEFDLQLSLHMHAVVFRADMSATDLCSLLKSHFPGPRRVNVKPLNSEGTVLEQIERVLLYCTKSFPTRHAAQIFQSDTSTFSRSLGALLLARSYLGSTHYHGVRTAMNLRTTRKWRNGVLFDPQIGSPIVIPEMEAGILAGRQRRRRALLAHGYRRPPDPKGGPID